MYFAGYLISKIDRLHSEHVADLLAEDFECVFRARVPSDDNTTHVAVDLMAFIAVPKLNLVKRLICDNAIRDFLFFILIFLFIR
jgi:hypothetical protein